MDNRVVKSGRFGVDSIAPGSTGKWIVWDMAPGVHDRASVGRIIDMDDPVVRKAVESIIRRDSGDSQ